MKLVTQFTPLCHGLHQTKPRETDVAEKKLGALFACSSYGPLPVINCYCMVINCYFVLFLFIFMVTNGTVIP